MQDLQCRGGSISNGETSWDDGDLTEDTTRKNNKELIAQANTIPLTDIFKLYHILLDYNNLSTRCPFKSHKNGLESSASFHFYPETNSYYCFGCHEGGKFAHAVEFISTYEKISRIKAAKKLIDGFDTEEILELQEDYSKNFQIMVQFSNLIRTFTQSNIYNEKAQIFINKICETYDKINLKHNLNSEALERIVNELQRKINQYR